MELRQLRYFIRVVELGSLSRAAAALGLAEQDLAGEMAALDADVSAPLLRGLGGGITPTEAGIRFFQEAQLALRHAEQAMRAKDDAPLAGTVRIGLTPTVAAVLGLPLLRDLLERYPGVQLQLVEGLSGHLAGLLSAHGLDLAVLHGAYPGRHWAVVPLLNERLHFIQSASRPGLTPLPPALRLAELEGVPLILPSSTHGLRAELDAAFYRYHFRPRIAAEIRRHGADAVLDAPVFRRGDAFRILRDPGSRGSACLHAVQPAERPALPGGHGRTGRPFRLRARAGAYGCLEWRGGKHELIETDSKRPAHHPPQPAILDLHQPVRRIAVL